MAETIPMPLREDLKIRRQVMAKEVCYVVKEPEKQEYYRFDDGQYGMLALFDGKRTLPQLVNAFNASSEEYEYDVTSTRELFKSAKSLGLLTRTRAEENAALIERLRETRKQQFLQRKGSLLFMRFHVVDPDKLFDRMIDHIRFIWHPATVRACLGIMLLALVTIFIEGERFGQDFLRVSAHVFGSLEGFLTAWPLILVVIALHEFAHGLTCKHFGGEVHDMGFLLMVLINPCMYCNVNDAWLFENKRHKLYTVMAGIYFELLLGSLAVFVWYFTDVNSVVGMLAFVVITVCISATVLFNLNPLMKLDGYYMLSDYLEIPNLRQNAIGTLSWSIKRYVLRMQLEPPVEAATDREMRIFLIYGAAMCVYLGGVFGKLAQMGYGFFGQTFGFVGVCVFLTIAYKFFSKLLGTWPETIATLFKKLFWTGWRKWMSLILLGGLIPMLIFWSPRMRISAPCELDAERLVIHAPETGFVVYAAYGEDRRPTGTPGEPLLRMASEALDLEAGHLAATGQTLQVERRMADAGGTSGALRRIGVRERGLAEEKKLLDARRAALTVRLPGGDWLVDGPPPQGVTGRRYEKGQTVLTLIPARTRTATVTLDQSDFSHVEPGQAVTVLLPGAPFDPLPGTVTRVAPAAKSAGMTQEFDVRVKVSLPEGATLPLGLTGTAAIHGAHRPLWMHLLRPLKKMMRFDIWI